MLELHENLKKILQAKNLETFYSEIYGQKIFVYVGLNLETWLFNDEKIYKLQDGEFKLSSIEEFSNFIKSILEDFKVQNTHFQNLLEHKEGIILKGGFVKNFYKKSFVLRQKINKNLKQINLLSEAFNLLLSEQAQYKKHLKILNLSISILSKNRVLVLMIELENITITLVLDMVDIVYLKIQNSCLQIFIIFLIV